MQRSVKIKTMVGFKKVLIILFLLILSKDIMSFPINYYLNDENPKYVPYALDLIFNWHKKEYCSEIINNFSQEEMTIIKKAIKTQKKWFYQTKNTVPFSQINLILKTNEKTECKAISIINLSNNKKLKALIEKYASRFTKIKNIIGIKWTKERSTIEIIHTKNKETLPHTLISKKIFKKTKKILNTFKYDLKKTTPTFFKVKSNILSSGQYINNKESFDYLILKGVPIYLLDPNFKEYMNDLAKNFKIIPSRIIYNNQHNLSLYIP